jgi:hypothetical protein
VLVGMDAVGQRHMPQRLDHRRAFLVGDGGLDQLGEAHGVRRRRLRRLGLGPQRRRGTGLQPVAVAQHLVYPRPLGPGIVPVGPRQPHHQRRQRQTAVLGGQRLG